MTTRNASGAAATIRGTISRYTAALADSSRKRPAGSLRWVAPPFFIGAGRYQDDRGIAQNVVVPGPERNSQREDRSVLQIGDGASRALSRVAVHENNLARGIPAASSRTYTPSTTAPAPTMPTFMWTILE